MKVSEKYSSATENDDRKHVMSNGAFAICEMLKKLILKLGMQTAAMRKYWQIQEYSQLLNRY